MNINGYIDIWTKLLIDKLRDNSNNYKTLDNVNPNKKAWKETIESFLDDQLFNTFNNDDHVDIILNTDDINDSIEMFTILLTNKIYENSSNYKNLENNDPNKNGWKETLEAFFDDPLFNTFNSHIINNNIY